MGNERAPLGAPGGLVKYNILQYFHFFVPQKRLISNMGLIFCITSVCDIKLVYISPLENVPISVSTNLLPKMAEDRYFLSFLPGSDEGVMKFTLSQITSPLSSCYRLWVFLNISIFSTKSD